MERIISLNIQIAAVFTGSDYAGSNYIGSQADGSNTVADYFKAFKHYVLKKSALVIDSFKSMLGDLCLYSSGYRSSGYRSSSYRSSSYRSSSYELDSGLTYDDATVYKAIKPINKQNIITQQSYLVASSRRRQFKVYNF